jgi:5-methylcytosine-specific restriction endonuclease McrA
LGNGDCLSGSDLIDFVQNKMTMSSYYQPLVIKSLVECGGSMSADDLARVLLLEDRFATGNALRTLMRWPKRTLEKHGIVRYQRAGRSFELLVRFEDARQRERVLQICEQAVRGWQKREATSAASRFFAVIDRANGRCEACGIPGSIRQLDVDHVVPKAHARKGKIRLPDGSEASVDDVRNLQALCERCNRGKRDTSTQDFRLSPERLAETIASVLERARELDLDVGRILSMAAESRGSGQSAVGAIGHRFGHQFPQTR